MTPAPDGFTQDDLAYLKREYGIDGTDGWHIEYPDGGYDRPGWQVENEDEIRLNYQDGERHKLTCGYCGAKKRTRDVEIAVDWFHTHPCNAQKQDVDGGPPELSAIAA